MADVALLKMPVEAGLELRPIVGLDDQDPKGEPPNNLIHKADRRSLVARIVDLEHPDARAIVDGSELVQTLLRAGDPLEELNVQLQAMPGLRLLVALPSASPGPMLLIGRQPVQAVANQDAVHRRACEAHLVKALQIISDPTWPKVIELSQVENFGDHLPRSRPGGAQRYTGTITQSGFAVCPVSRSPFIKALSRDAEATAGLCHASGRYAGFSQQL